MEYTEQHFPKQKVHLDSAKKCFFCNQTYEEDSRDVTL